MRARDICLVAPGLRTRRRWEIALYLSLLFGVGLLVFETLHARTWSGLYGDNKAQFGRYGDNKAQFGRYGDSMGQFGLHGDRVQSDTVEDDERQEVELTEFPGTRPESIASRKSRVICLCSLWSKIAFRPLVSHWRVSRKHQFLYCPVEKTASTFWRRFLHQLEYTSPMRSPFDVDVKSLYASRDKNLEVTESGEDLAALWSNTTKLLFVRDPYSRLYSAYVDKLLSPNPTYWNNWGKTAILKYRNTTAEAVRGDSCGDDVTFPEFIRYAVSQDGQSDTHVMSIYRLCTPCKVNYTVIGKMETFSRDTRHLLSVLRINESQLGLERMADDVTRDAVVDSVKDAMSRPWLDETLRCITRADVVRRIWRKLQIRGFVSWRFNYGIDPQTVTAMDGASLVEVLKQAVRASTNRTELGIQKRQAMVEAFSRVTPSQIAAIKRTFFLDFQMFDYDSSPPSLANSRTGVAAMTDAFDWRKDWDLSPAL
ncbi:unnamed protein product [Lymnaea stagnalis]|uniref:Carbohydrate sulfotransferase n=1 Tax=Lymnaea stagnalis TaxID=6523 RepID=A0AAV2I5M6_LYMST